MLHSSISTQLEQLSADHGPDFVVELIDLFNEDAPEFLASLETAHADDDVAGVERAAHALRGCCLNFNATELANACREIEYVARGGARVDGSLVASLKNELAQANEVLATARDHYAALAAA